MMVQMYKALGVELPGKVAVKLHSGEVGNQNFIRPAFLKPVIDHVHGTIVECNTAYSGKRDTTEAHWETILVRMLSPILLLASCLLSFLQASNPKTKPCSQQALAILLFPS